MAAFVSAGLARPLSTCRDVGESSFVGCPVQEPAKTAPRSAARTLISWVGTARPRRAFIARASSASPQLPAHSPVASGSGLASQLPAVRGKYQDNYPLSKLTWFGVGGRAEVLFTPEDEEDLAEFLAKKPAGVPVTVIGVGSNLLVRDGGVDGVVVRMGKAFAEVRVEGVNVTAGAAALDLNVSKACRDAGVAGFEFLSGIPGTVGGMLKMNAGAYGDDASKVVLSARAVDPQGTLRELLPADLGFSYRHSAVPDGWVFVSARMAGRADSVEAIAGRMAKIQADREASQPIRSRTGGSTFANPPNEQGLRAWQLVDAVGGRGLRRGGAMISEKHCNFMINTGDASAADLEDLGDEIIRRVREQFGIEMRWEIQRIGKRL